MQNETIPASIAAAIAHTTAEAAGTAPILVTPETDAAIERTLAQRENEARSEATAAGGMLSRILERGRIRAGGVVRRIMHEIPKDYIVPCKQLSWGVSDKGAVTAGTKTRFGVHPHAFGQAATRYDIPSRYIRGLTAPGGAQWRRELAETTLNDHAANDTGRMLVRTYDGQIRAFLSDRYRRLDSRPLLDAFLGACADTGMEIYSGRASDVKVTIKALHPQVWDIHGDPCVFGLEWSNSDYGAGKHSVRTFLLRMVCLNGMTGESAMDNVHLGRRIGDDASLSKRTYALDTRTMVSALTDVVTAVSSAPKIKAAIERVRTSSGESIDLGASFPAALRKALSKPEQDRLRELFDSGEAVMLPPNPTKYRLANALSWMVNTIDSPDRQIELERLAGNVAGL